MRELRYRLSQRLGDLWAGTLTNTLTSGTATATITTRLERAGVFSGGMFRVGTQGAQTVEEKPIAAYTGAGAFTVGSNWSATHNPGEEYELHTKFTAAEYNRMLLDALADARGEAVLSNLRYTALVWVQDQWEYDLPTNFKYIDRVEILGTNGRPEYRYRNEDLDVLAGIPKKLEFPRWATHTPGLTIRITGQGSEQDPTNVDTGIVVTDESFLLAHAELHARARLASLGGDIGAVNRTRLRDLNTAIELKRAAMSTAHRALPGSLIVP